MSNMRSPRGKLKEMGTHKEAIDKGSNRVLCHKMMAMEGTKGGGERKSVPRNLRNRRTWNERWR